MREKGEGRRYLDPLGDYCDIASLCDSDCARALRSRNRVLFVEDFLKLLEGSPNSLDTDEVPDDGLDDVPTNEDKHVVVFDIL